MTKETKDLGAAPPRSLTEADLQELERALRAASPVPWRKSADWDDPGVGVHDEEDGWIRGPGGIVIDYAECGSHKWNIRPADRAYLLAAVNAAPSLISDLRRERAARESAEKAHRDDWGLCQAGLCDGAEGERRAALIEAAELVRRINEAADVPGGNNTFERSHALDCAERQLLDLAALATGTAPQAPSDSSAALLEARRLLEEVRREFLWGGTVKGREFADRLRAFLRSDSERSEPARSESGGRKVVHDPSEEGR